MYYQILAPISKVMHSSVHQLARYKITLNYRFPLADCRLNVM